MLAMFSSSCTTPYRAHQPAALSSSSVSRGWLPSTGPTQSKRVRRMVTANYPGQMLLWFLLFMLRPCLATLSDDKNILYVVPRPGVDKKTDCYTNTYHQEIERDLNIMQELGATTVVASNAWQYNAQHSQFLKGLVQLNMSLAITLIPQLGDNSMRRYLESISSELRKHQVKLEFINIDYDLDFDNAEKFFMFAGKLRTWLDQLEFTCPLVVQFFRDVSSDVQIQSLLEAWDWSQFDAWGTTVFSDQQIRNWLAWASPYRKKILFFYGADSVSLSGRRLDDAAQAAQQRQISRLWDELQDIYSTAPSPSSNASLSNSTSSTNLTSSPTSNRLERRNSHPVLLGVALNGYVDSFFLGSESQNYQGSPTDICPDNNPYLQTTCGVRDAFVTHGDAIVSVEHLGIFSSTETLLLTRCVIPKRAVATLRKLWRNTTDAFSASEYCCFSISVYPLELVWVTLSFVLAAVLVSVAVTIASSCIAYERARWLQQAKLDREERLAAYGERDKHL